MDLVSLVVVLVVIGLALWLINTFIPMEARIKSILNAVVIIGVVLWLVVRVLLPHLPRIVI